MKTERILMIVVMVILIIILAFFLGQCTKQCPKPTTSVNTKYDTVWVTVQIPPDTFYIARPHIVYRKELQVDTLWNESLRDTIFTALDEFITAKKDTIHTEFLFPEIQFSHKINYAKDSIKTIIKTIQVEKVTIQERAWWEVPAYILSGAFGGYLLGRATK